MRKNPTRRRKAAKTPSGFFRVPNILVAMFCESVAEEQDPVAWTLLNSMFPKRDYTLFIAEHAPHVFIRHNGELQFYWPPSRQLKEAA